MGSAAGGGGQPRAEQNPYSSLQAGWSDQMMQHIAPFLASVIGQGNQLSRTGNIVQQNSLLGTLTESARSGVAKGRQATQDILGRGRLAGTPFGQRILADQAVQGEQSIAQVKPNFFQWFLPIALNAATGNAQTAQSGLSSASGAEAQRISSQVGAQGQYATQQAANYGQMMTKMIPQTSFSFQGKV